MNHDHPTSSDLTILHEFLANFDSDAEAHARVPLSEDETRGIELLARGELDGEDRSTLVPLLARNELAIELLASLLKKSP